MSRPLHWHQELKTVASQFHAFLLVKICFAKIRFTSEAKEKKKKEKKPHLYQKLEADGWLLIFCAALIIHAVIKWSGTARFSRIVVEIRFSPQWEIRVQCLTSGDFSDVLCAESDTLPGFVIILNTFLAHPKRLILLLRPNSHNIIAHTTKPAWTLH